MNAKMGMRGRLWAHLEHPLLLWCSSLCLCKPLRDPHTVLSPTSTLLPPDLLRVLSELEATVEPSDSEWVSASWITKQPLLSWESPSWLLLSECFDQYQGACWSNLG